MVQTFGVSASKPSVDQSYGSYGLRTYVLMMCSHFAFFMSACQLLNMIKDERFPTTLLK
jgi:hypothetical protein